MDDHSVPAIAQKWNWGAFLLTWIWGLGNRVFISLLMFVPLVNIVVWFALGLKGGRWAWEQGNWSSEEDFAKAQKVWTIAGIIVWAGGLALTFLIVGLVALLSGVMKNNYAYTESFTRAQNNSAVVSTLGTPLESGFPQGNISTTNDSGTASINYALTGPDGEGRVYVTATRERGEWRLDTCEIKLPETTVDC